MSHGGHTMGQCGGTGPSHEQVFDARIAEPSAMLNKLANMTMIASKMAKSFILLRIIDQR